MSGPKVVRIVTREEVLEICRGHMARVDAALAEWTRVGLRNGSVDDEAVQTAGRRRDALAALIAADRFMDLQKQAATEESFLREDIQTRLAAASAAQARARSKERRERDAASTLLRTLRASGRPIDPELVAGLEGGDADALSRGFLTMAQGEAPSAATSEAAAALRGAEPRLTLAEWLATQPSPATNPAVERVAARMDELSVWADDATMSAWRARLAEAETAPTARRALLLDGLEIETGRALTARRSRQSALDELQATLAELRVASIATTMEDADLTMLDEAAIIARTEEARSALEAHRASRAAEARRAAVLQGLAGLGYEVAEGMSTTWVSEGRLALRSATRPDYGVEVSGGESGRMQMRAVAFEAGGVGPDPSRDRDAETIWCGDVTGLEDRLAQIGGGLVIERALPVGATPLKRIAIDTPQVTANAASVPSMKQRTLR